MTLKDCCPKTSPYLNLTLGSTGVVETWETSQKPVRQDIESQTRVETIVGSTKYKDDHK